jgi:TonB family protein
LNILKLIALIFLLTKNLLGQINSLDSSQRDTTIYLTADVEPKFSGDTLLKFLYHNIKYPPINRCEVSGTIFVEFIVEKSGKITNPKILKSFHSSYDNEILRVINIMPNWTAGYKNSIAVRTKRVIPIRIHLR